MCHSFEPQALISAESTDEAAVEIHCAVEGVRIWLAWLDAGAGIDTLDDFMPSVMTFWHRLAASSDAPDGMWFLCALLLKLIRHVHRDDNGSRPVGGLSESNSASLRVSMESLSVLAKVNLPSSPSQKLHLSELVELLAEASPWLEHLVVKVVFQPVPVPDHGSSRNFVRHVAVRVSGVTVFQRATWTVRYCS